MMYMIPTICSITVGPAAYTNVDSEYLQGNHSKFVDLWSRYLPC